MTQLSSKLLDVSALSIVAESDTHTMHACTSCSSHSVEVPFGLVRKAEVNDSLYIRDVKASRDQVSCQQVVNMAPLKEFDSLHAFLLSQVALYLSSLEAKYFEEDKHAVALNLLIEEYYDSLLKAFENKSKESGLSSN